MTFQSLYDIYIKDMCSRYKDNTVDGYRTVFRKLILPYFGEKAINKITAKDIRA